MEQKTAHLRIKPRRVLPEGDGGTIFWATPTRARQLLEIGAVEMLNAPGPAETKPAGPLEKKFSAADPAGPSTDSAPSSQPGPAAVLSASVAGPASPKRKSPRSRKPTPPAGA